MKISTFSVGGEESSQKMIVPQSFDSSSNDEVLSHKSGHGFASGGIEILWGNTAHKFITS